MFNRDQWIESFEGQLSLLRPHLTARVLDTMSLAAWHEFGRAEVDPIKAAKELSKLLDTRRLRPIDPTVRPLSGLLARHR